MSSKTLNKKESAKKNTKEARMPDTQKEQLFELDAPFKPSGDQPEAIKGLVESIKKGEQHSQLLGVTGSGKSVIGDTDVYIRKRGEEQCLKISEVIDSFFDNETVNTELHGDVEVYNFDETTHIDFEALSFNPETGEHGWKQITQFSRHESPAGLYNVVTACGRSVTVTGDHNFFVLRDGEIQLLQTSQIQSTDFIPVPRILPEPDNTITKLEWVQYLEDTEKERLIEREHGIGYKGSKKYTLPKGIEITKLFLQFFGYYLAEGHAADGYIILSSADQEIVNHIQGFCDEYGLHMRHRPNSVDYQISFKLLRDILVACSGSHSYSKRLPQFWSKLSNKDLAILLAAFFAGDGGVEKNAIKVTLASSDLISDIQLALLRFGIIARVREREIRKNVIGSLGTYWELSISGQKNISLYKKNIGFTLERKQVQLQKLGLKKGNTNVDVIPVSGEWLSSVREQLGVHQRQIAKQIGVSRSLLSFYESNKRKPSVDVFIKYMDVLHNYATQAENLLLVEEIEQRKNLSSPFWTSVKQIDVVPGEEFVYDFAVEDNETFLAGRGGLFVHNTFTMANVIHELQRPTLIISHNKTLAAQLAGEFREFFPKAAVHYFVSYYDYYQPEAYIARTDTYIEKETEINEEIDRLRHASTQAILSRRDTIIVASVSCIYSLGKPDDYLRGSVRVRRSGFTAPAQEIGSEIVDGALQGVSEALNRQQLIIKLVEMNFDRNDIDFHRGTFRVRGDVIEVYPTSNEHTVLRFDFWGDDIESIQEVDALTGEVMHTFDEVIIYPATLYTSQTDHYEDALIQIRKDMEKEVKAFQDAGKILEAHRLEKRTKFDIEMIENIGYVSGIENYSRYFDGRKIGESPYTLIDYFPDDALIIIDESHQTIPQIGAMFAGDRSRKTQLVEHGFRVSGAFDNRPLKFEEFESRGKQRIYVSATPGKYEKAHATTTVEQLIRPTGITEPDIHIKPTKGQIPHLMKEAKKRIEKGQRVLVTTLTKRMAEELADYLNENGVAVQYIHSDVDTMERLEILRDLRLGKYDVLVGINLLREGLDLPEVSLVAILDADKEGFLRSETSLVQTMGRAARHVEGEVILYADRITGSMERAIGEVERRREKQEAYNKKNGINPQQIIKKIRDDRLSGKKEEVVEEIPSAAELAASMSKSDLAHLASELRAQMELAAENLDFEKAAALRDQVNDIEGQLDLNATQKKFGTDKQAKRRKRIKK